MTEPTPIASRLVCHGCGTEVPSTELLPFVCAHRDSDEVDHLPTRVLDSKLLQEPVVDVDSEHPFVRYRSLLHVWHLARARGVSDHEYCTVVARLDQQVAAVSGCGFRRTPFALAPRLGAALTGEPDVWIKDETNNVAGSHKARHLFGILLHLELLGDAIPATTPLAISSCGNAALAAAHLAAAARRPLQVFVPEWGDAGTISQLAELGAEVNVCKRDETQAGDPCYHAFRAAVGAGALPFCCQGSENALTIDGGRTIAYEISEALQDNCPNIGLVRFFVQVGGGALASACVQGFADAVQVGWLPVLPRIHAVQAQGGAPLDRAFRKIIEAGGRRGLAQAAQHRSDFMWPWETAPYSIATGILDDETYDWWEIVAGIMASGGESVVAEESQLKDAWEIAQRSTEIPVCATGAAGLAGALQVASSERWRTGETTVVLFTGVKR
ncbi:MAG: pyridoxal-phosphate dependent enzyme [Planctomycetota bacterium]